MSAAARDGEEKPMRQECFVVADFGARLCHLCHRIPARCAASVCVATSTPMQIPFPRYELMR